MTDAKNERPPAHVAARQSRLREALRENLKRRKFQSRGRAEQLPEPGDAGGSVIDTTDARPGRIDRDGHD